MSNHPAVPLWLWRAVTLGFGLALVSIGALAAALYFGLADPPRAGPRLWSDDFSGDLSRWQWLTSGGGALAPQNGALIADFTAPEQIAVALADGPAGDFTLEMTGAQSGGEIGAAYGLVFDWRDADHYSAVLINGNGYAEAYRQNGAVREAWFAWQQWPHILVGAEGNSVRVDVRRGAVLVARINDEVLIERVISDRGTGRIGVLARSSGPGRVIFGWVQVWAAK
jgi:hypothetical protein